MKKSMTLFAVVTILLMICIGTWALADTYTYTVTQNDVPGNLTVKPVCNVHNFQLKTVRVEATCTKAGSGIYACTVCGVTKDETTIPALGHSAGSWVVTQQANCQTKGVKQRSCTRCGVVVETADVAKTDHIYGTWRVTVKATCKETGTQEAMCTVCGAVTTKSVPKGEHTFGKYKVLREATCKTAGKREATCKVCGEKVTKSIKKGDHSFGGWTVTKEPTDHTKGKRSHTCDVCGKKESEEFYPEGTLYKGGDNPEDEVKELQSALKQQGFFKKAVKGKFDNDTVSAVKRFQKKHGLKQDGIAWPQTLRLLGLRIKHGTPIMPEDLSDFKLQLTVEQTSSVQEAYHEGDEITYQWTLENASKKNDAKDVRVSQFPGMTTKIKSKTEKVIASPETLAKGESISGSFVYKVTSKDVLAGSFTLGFIGRGKLGKTAVESNTVCFKNAATAGEGSEGGTWTPPEEKKPEEKTEGSKTEETKPEGGVGGIGGPVDLSAAALTVTKNVTNTPANGLHFEKGEEIKFHITVANLGKDPVKDILATDAMFPKLDGKIGTLAPGKGAEFDLTYKVTAADVAAGSVTNVVIVSYPMEDGKLGQQKAEATASTGLPIDGLVVTKKLVNTPANGKFFVPGETVKFEIQVTNPTMENFTNVHLYDLLKSKKVLSTKSSIKAGETVTFPFSWTVTELQAKAGSFLNTAKVTYYDPSKSKRLGVSNACKVPVGFPGQDGIEITKTIISKPENGKYYQDGEEIRYEIQVTNNTLETLQDFAIRDSLALFDTEGHRTVVEGKNLDSMETFSVHFSYIVGPYDVEQTKVVNQASVAWKPVRDVEAEIFSEKVIAPTAEVVKERKPEPPKVEGKACESVLTAMGDGIAWHDLSECDEHTGTAKESAGLMQGGSYSAAEDLWTEDIYELYDEWSQNTDSMGRQAAENDQMAFERQLDAWRTSMNLLYTLDEDQVDALVVDELMNKTVGLCYELHAAPEQRPDSVASKHQALNEANEEDECTRTVTFSTNGAAHYVECQCETHTLTNQMTQYLLDMAVDQEDRETAWLRAQANWLLELNDMYDTWYLASDETERGLIAADRMAFDEAIAARREALADLYPDNPDIAAEVLSNMIMQRTQIVCQALHQAEILND